MHLYETMFRVMPSLTGVIKFISEFFSMRRPRWKTKFPLSQSTPPKTNMDTQNDGVEKVVPYILQFLASGGVCSISGGVNVCGGFISCTSPLQHGPEKHQNLGSNSLRLGFLDPFGPPKTQLMKLPLQQNS